MAAFGAGDQVADQAAIHELPNFVGELFKLSPLDTPFLSMIGGLTGGKSVPRPVFTWQDTIHRAPALQAVAEGADAGFTEQKRNERSNVAAIHQYGVELTYSKQAATGLLGSGGATPTTGATSILGDQPVGDEMSYQVQIQVEQAALDVELSFLTGTYAWLAAGQARQTQGINGAVSTDTSTDNQTPAVAASRTIVNNVAQKMWDNGAPMTNVVLMMNSQEKLDLGLSYSNDGATGAWNVQPRSYNVFGVNVTDLETEFGKFPIVLNRHVPANTILAIDLAYCNPCFMPIPGKGHFFLEPLAKSGAYDRMQLYGEVGLEYGPAGWHGREYNLNTA